MTVATTPLGTVPRQPVADWLQGIIAEATGWPCGHCEAPKDDAGALVGLPYTVLWPIVGAASDGPPLWLPDCAGWTIWQVDYIGASPAQVGMLGDRTRAGILGRAAGGFAYNPTAEGFRVPERSPMDGDAVTPTYAGTVKNPIWSAPERFQLYVDATPEGEQ